MASPESKYALSEKLDPKADETPELKEKFSTGLFSICAAPGGVGRCCFVTCCGMCAFATEVARFPSGSFCCAGNCKSAFCVYAFLTCGNGHWDPILGWMVRCPARSNVRRVTGIKESDCADCILSAFCPHCATCQELRELDILEAKLLKMDERNRIKMEEEKKERFRMTAPPQMQAPEAGGKATTEGHKAT